MSKLANFFTGLAVLAMMAGCTAQQEEGSGSMAAASAVSEVPITTSSDAAMADFLAGQEALDIGGPREVLEANAAFKRAVEKDPDFAYAYLNVANTFQSVTEFKEYTDLAAAHSAGASDGEKLLIEINQTFLNNDAERRLQLAKQLVEKYAAGPRAWLALAGAQGALNKNEEARASIERALELDPEFFAGYSALGFQYLFAEPREFVEAEYNMKRAVDLRPENGQPQVNLGDVYRARQDLEGARASYTRGTELDPENAVAFVKKGHVGSFLGYYDEARVDYDRSIELAPVEQKANFANYRAFVHIHAGDPNGAIAELSGLVASVEEMGTPADQVNGSKIFALTNQAVIAMHHGVLDVAERALKQRAQLLMENANKVGTEAFIRNQKANVLSWEGQLAARRGDFEAAVQKAEENARLLEPDNNPRKLEAYHNVMGLVSLLQENYAEAVEHYKKANHLNNWYIRYHLSLAQEGAGNHAEAQRLFKEVAEYNFNSVGYALVRKEAQQKLMKRVSMRD